MRYFFVCVCDLYRTEQKPKKAVWPVKHTCLIPGRWS